MKPPHLPRKTKDLILKETYRFVWSVLFLVLIAFITSVAATLTTIAWIAPFSVTDTSYTLRANRASLESAAHIDPMLEKQVRQRLVRVYNTKQKVQNEYYSEAAFVGQAMMLTSEGWAVMYTSNYSRGAEKHWEIVDHQGIIFTVEKSFQDSVSGLVYIKIAGDGFRGDISFLDWNTFDMSESLSSLSLRGVVPAAFDRLEENSESKQYELWKPRFFHTIVGDVSSGDVLIAENGAFVGFVNSDKKIIESWLISTQLQPLFEKEKNEYKALPLTGYRVEGVVVDDMFENIHGFLVTKSNTKASSTTVGAGDVILRIEGLPFDEVTSARVMLFAPETILMQVLRDGKKLDMLVNKSVL
jgi:hypothetical protein